MTSLHDILNSQGFYIYSCLKYVKALLDTLYTWVGIQLLKTNLTFLVVLQFEIYLHLDNFSSSFLFQKYNLGFKRVNFENNDFLIYLCLGEQEKNCYLWQGTFVFMVLCSKFAFWVNLHGCYGCQGCQSFLVGVKGR